jgi:two-component system chemotaxis sensor kinase CheA
MTDNELLNIFRAEVNEYLETLNETLLKVEVSDESSASYRPMLVEMNRVSHSMKGAARSVGMKPIESVAYYMEEIFSGALKQQLSLSPDVCDTLYDALDALTVLIQGGAPEEDEFADLLERFQTIVSDAATDTHQNGQTHPNGQRSNGTSTHETAEIKFVSADVDANTDEHDDLSNPISDPAAAVTFPSIQTSQTMAIPTAASTTLWSKQEPLDSQTLSLHPLEETVRVSVNKLDRLMSEATELFIASMHAEERELRLQEIRRTHSRWQREWRGIRMHYIHLERHMEAVHAQIQPEIAAILRFLDTNERYLTEMNRRLAQLVQSVAQDRLYLSALADQMQDDISGMRLMPLDSLVNGFQRTVRDVSRELNKQVLLEIEGANIEIDKTVLDTLRDPLLHLIRNAIDHGIEMPQARQRIGKPPAGILQIVIEQRGSEIIIAIADDGGGINTERVKRTAIQQQLLTESMAQTLSDEEIQQYIFQPGLTTSTVVTGVSGRGMGMDIVRERVEGLRGRVQIRSQLGVGTTITITVPVSLTRLRCILLKLNEQVFAIPSSVVARMQMIPADELFTAEGQEMLLINGQPVPCLKLSSVLGMPDTASSPSLLQILVLRAGDRIHAFEVDELFSEQELVLKPLGREVANAHYISGAAVLGSGEIAIILNANDLARAASGRSIRRRRPLPVNEQTAVTRRSHILIVDDSITTRTLEKNILETAGFQVEVAVHGQQAWEMLADRTFDLIISDVEMPKMNGLELTRHIKSDARLSRIPLILLTSLQKPEQRAAGLEAGADAYLIKSQFDQGELLQLIYSLI